MEKLKEMICDKGVPERAGGGGVRHGDLPEKHISDQARHCEISMGVLDFGPVENQQVCSSSASVKSTGPSLPVDFQHPEIICGVLKRPKHPPQ